MHLLIAFALLATLAISEHTPREAVGHSWRALAIVVATGILIVLLARWMTRATVRRLLLQPERRAEWFRRYGRWRTVHAAVWLLVTVGASYLASWPQVVRFDWQLANSILVDDLLILGPVLLPLVLSWAVFHDVEMLAGKQDAEASRVGHRWRSVWLFARHQIGLLLVPVLVLLGIQDTLQRYWPELAHGEAGWLFMAAPLAAMCLGFPLLLRRIWPTHPLPAGPLRDRLEAAAARWNFRTRDILVWHTDGRMANAAVTGVLPQMRYVFLTDGLLRHLEADEIEAVFGHEVGHVRHHHFLLRGMAVLAPIVGWLTCTSLVPGLAETVRSMGNQLGLQRPEFAALAGLAAVGVSVTALFGVYSRRLEHQADLFGCRGTEPDTPLTEAGISRFIATLEKLAVLNGVSRRAGGWQHASIARRVEFLHQVARKEGQEGRFQRRTWWLGATLIAVVIGSIVLQMLLG